MLTWLEYDKITKAVMRVHETKPVNLMDNTLLCTSETFKMGDETLYSILIREVNENNELLRYSARRELESVAILKQETDMSKEKIRQLEDTLATATQVYEKLDKGNMPVEDLRIAKIDQLKELCTLAIYDGFTSTSTGYTFGFNSHDQQNFDQQYLLIVSGDNAGADVEWKSKDAGVVTLTEAEFRSVVKEAKDHKLTQQNKYWTLEAQVLSATTNAEIDAVVW